MIIMMAYQQIPTRHIPTRCECGIRKHILRKCSQCHVNVFYNVHDFVHSCHITPLSDERHCKTNRGGASNILNMTKSYHRTALGDFIEVPKTVQRCQQMAL